MTFWIIKGNPRTWDLDKKAKAGRVEGWRTAKPPQKWLAGDRVFFWSSAPRLELVALGVFLGETGRTTADGQTLYRIRYQTSALAGRVSSSELRADPICGSANFLKRSVAQGVLEVPEEQAWQMYRLLRRASDGSLNKWRDIPLPDAVGLPDAEGEALEGAPKLRTHFARERNTTLVRRKKAQVLRMTGALVCEVCQFNFAECYGKLGEQYCEVHHLLPLASAKQGVRTHLKDLAIVCSNCHRMLHRQIPLLSIRQLQARLVDAAAVER